MNYETLTNTSVISRSEDEIANTHTQQHQQPRQMPLFNQDQEFQTQQLDQPSRGEVPNSDLVSGSANSSPSKAQQHSRNYHLKHVQQQIHTNGSPEKKPSRKTKHPVSIKKAVDQFVDVDENDKPQEDEIVIPEHLISQVHTNVKSDPDKRLSTVTTSSYTKKVKKNYVGPWKLGRTLGRGATGRVRLAKHSKTGQLAAVKIVPKSTFKDNGNNDNMTNGIEREIIIMKLISHPNIMALYDVWENKGELYLILEYVECGELFNYLVKKIRLDEREAVHYFKQIISGINYCHSFNICHRDLKPENLLLDKYHNIKIADFGMAALEVTNKMLNTSCGSPHYASPEVVMGESYHGGPSDIWSCGIILFALLTGHLPFDDDHMTRLLAKVRSGIFRIPSYVSSEARDLIKKMLTVNPEKRITIEEILAHPLLQKYPDTGFYYPRNKKNKNYMESPLPKDIMKQPIPPETVDKEILKNLQTLWHGERKSKILEKLMTNDENAEKLFYYLLLKYRQEHAAPPPSKTKSKKKPIMQTSGDTTARDLIKDKKLAMTKSTSIVSTTIIDESGNKVTHISKEPLSNHAKVRSTSYKKLTNSKYSLNKIESSTSRSNLASGQSSNNINKRKTRDIDGHMVISASLSYRKGISFNTHSRTKSTNSFKSFKNTSPYNSFYNFKNYQGLDAAVASNDIPQKIETAVVSAPENNITPAIPSKRDSGSHSLMTKSMSKRDSFNAFSLSSIENYAAYIDHPFELPASTSGKSLTSPKKKQRKSLTDSHSVLADMSMSNSVKRLSGVSSRSKRSILNNSTSKKSIRYKTKARKDLLKKPALNLPELPRLPNELPALKTNAAAFSPRHDLTSGLSTNEFAFFCEQVFGFEKETPNHSASNKSSLLEHLSDYDELKKLYQQKIMIQKQEELKKEQERLAAINEAKALAEKVKEIFEKARLLEIENQQLLKEREAKERSASLPTDANSDSNFEDSKALDPSKLKQRRAVSEAANPEPSQRQSPKKATKVGKAPKQKKSLLGINSTLLNSPTGALIENSSTINGSPTRQSKKDLKTLPSLLTGGTNEEDKFQDAMESLGRQTTASTFSFDFNSPKNQSLISSNSILGDKKPSFNFGHSSTKTPAVPIPEETSSGRKSSVSSEVPSSKFELSFPTPITPSKFDFKSDKKVSLFSNFSNNSSNKFSFHFSPSENKPSSDKLVTTTVVAKSDKLKRNSSIKASPVNNKFSLVPQRDAPKPPQSKAALAVLAASPSSTPSSKLQSTQTNVKTIVTKGNSLIVKANATTKTTSLPELKKLDGTTSAPLTPLAITSASTPTTATTSTNVTGTTDGTSHESVNRALEDNVSTTSSTSKTLTGAQKTTSSSSTAKAKLITLDKSQDTAATASPASAGAGAATGGSPVVPSAVGTESSDDKEGELAGSKYSKAPSITTTTASSIITNPKTKQSWFSKVINNFVPSASHEDEFRYESFLLVEDVQTLIRNSLTLRLKEGSVSKVKFDTNGISTVVPAKLANGRSLKVKISINPLKSSRNDNKLLNYKKKSVVSVIKEKGLAKAFSKMGQTIQLTIQNEENQFKTRETRLLKRYD